jgi:hypothetical protein
MEHILEPNQTRYVDSQTGCGRRSALELRGLAAWGLGLWLLLLVAELAVATRSASGRSACFTTVAERNVVLSSGLSFVNAVQESACTVSVGAYGTRRRDEGK